jgi:hypothetical protein
MVQKLNRTLRGWAIWECCLREMRRDENGHVADIPSAISN